jgi:hypothetical protein
MTKVNVAAVALLIAWAIGPSDSQAQNTSLAPTPERHQNQTKGADPALCRIAVHISEEAERQPGGALHKGPVTGQPMMAQGQKMAEMSKVEGAHMIHRAQHGGAFFMAPNKLNHVEALYSDDCGFRAVFYNIRTEYIRADRFRAFIKVVPDSMDEPEVLRFLSPDQNGEVLRASIGDEVSKPFEIQLYVKFPEAEEPELFNIRVP